jgi:hypothetical protein
MNRFNQLSANIMTDGGMTIQLIKQARYASKALEGQLDIA